MGSRHTLAQSICAPLREWTLPGTMLFSEAVLPAALCCAGSCKAGRAWHPSWAIQILDSGRSRERNSKSAQPHAPPELLQVLQDGYGGWTKAEKEIELD